MERSHDATWSCARHGAPALEVEDQVRRGHAQDIGQDDARGARTGIELVTRTHDGHHGVANGQPDELAGG